MNRKNALFWFCKLLSAFKVHERLIPELLEIVAGSGYEEKFFSLLATRLKFLHMMGIRASEHEEFEVLGNGLFSMHLARHGFNIRILYAFLPDQTPCLLIGFFERGKKKKSDYTPYLTPARQRYQEIKGEL